MFKISYRLVAVLCVFGLGYIQPVAAATDQSNFGLIDQAHLTVGTSYVAPPFVGGSKVRTPEGIETGLVSELAGNMARTPQFVKIDPAAGSIPPGVVDFAVASLAENETHALGDKLTAIPTGYVTRPMAIMRTDTDIKTWDQLQGRTVCVSEDGRYVGSIARRYGATEQVYRAPADSLLALRVGQCDAAVHDDTVLKALLRFPEWKKFSAKLTSSMTTSQYLLVPTGNHALVSELKKGVLRWKQQDYLEKLVADMSRDIAFEVYLDQTVPDCH